MQPFEAVVIAYLVFFAVAALFARVTARTRAATAFVAASMAVAIYVVARTSPLELRLWLPFLYIAIGYWIPVPLVPRATGGAFELWLRRTDTVFWRKVGYIPRWLTSALELGYLACFPLVPISFGAVWTAGSPADVTRFWLGVLVAGYTCYITLPWLVSRPPRLIEKSVADVALTDVTRFNRFVLGHVSHRLNTFPSGHVAVSVAAALGAAKVWPAAGVLLGVVAAAVAVGAVVGRYHYFVDVVLGTAVGVAASF
jgi:membrane-associated phospholipid phosphatase